MRGEKKLRILFVEDLPPDYELAEMILEKNGISFDSVRVENKDDYIRELREFKPGMIISDYLLPEFDGMQALKILLEHDSSIPFIVLTGTLNEEVAVDCMKAGATDYVIKEHMGKLPFAVREAIYRRDAVIEKMRAESELLESELRYRSMFENNHAVMLLISPDKGIIVNANHAALEFYGYSRDRLVGMSVTDLSIYDRSISINRLRLALSGLERHYFSRHRIADGRIRDVEIFIGPLQYMGQTYLYSIVHDITERKMAESALQTSLQQKNDLIREVYHRTKNSLQVILSMFSLQALYSSDENMIKTLRDMESRIRAMALVHDKLYKSESLSRISLDEYISDLVEILKSGYGANRPDIEILEELDKIDVLIDTAIPCGLVINELVSNSYKHAFPVDTAGEIRISLKSGNAGVIECTVSDNGCGFGDSYNFRDAKSLGFQIINNIVEYQLKGDVNLTSSGGVKWVISFRDNIYEERI